MLKAADLPEGVTTRVEYHRISDGTELRLLLLQPPRGPGAKPPIVFLPGWISSVTGWRSVLEILSREHPVLYIETREKASARLPDDRPVDFSMDRLCADVDEILVDRIPEHGPFVFFGSSLGSTLVLDYLSRGGRNPILAFLVAPNLIFRLPRWVIIAAKLFPAAGYSVLKPVMKWYLCTFLLDEDAEPEQAERYRSNLDSAEPKRLRQNALELKDYSAWEKLPRVRVPVVVVTGESDSLHHMDDMKRMVSILPRARLEIMDSNRATHSAEAARLALREIRREMSSAGGSRGSNPSGVDSGVDRHTGGGDGTTGGTEG